MNAEKLKRLQSAVRTGGKGSVRRKKKIIHKQGGVDERKLQALFNRLKMTQIPGIEEVNLFKDDGTVIQFKNPKFQANFNANTYAVNGKPETKKAEEVLASVLTPEMLKNLAARFSTASPDSGEVPELIGNFEEAANRDEPKKEESKQEVKQEPPKKEEPKQEVKQEPPKQEEPKKEEPKQEVKQEPPKQEEPKKEEPKQEVKQEPPKQEEPKKEEPKKEEPKQEVKQEPPKQEEPKKEEPKQEVKQEPPKQEEPKKD